LITALLLKETTAPQINLIKLARFPHSTYLCTTAVGTLKYGAAIMTASLDGPSSACERTALGDARLRSS
jgi:predicted transcriptional regulator